MTSISRTKKKAAILSMLALLLLTSYGWGVKKSVYGINRELRGRRYQSSSPQRSIVEKRRLENGTDIAAGQSSDQGLGKHEDEDDDLPSCNDVLLHETIEERCHHAKNCDGEYLMRTLLPLAFCNYPSTQSPLDDHPMLRTFFPVLFPVSLLVMTLLLFRLLGSTAENYFSPALEMISSEFQIPPPLAGVTLLALGNGAPDVSAVVNAIKMSASEGIPLSLGELTGGGMFVQTVVVGRIVFLASGMAGKGVVCREELIRDITMYAISAGYVFWMCSRGVIFYRHVVAMLLLYCGYVAIVFIFEIRRYYSNSAPSAGRTANLDLVEDGNENEENGDERDSLLHLADEEDQSVELSPRHQPAAAKSKRPDPPGVKQSARVVRVMQKQQLRRQQRLREKRKSLTRESMGDPQDRSSLDRDDRETAANQPWSVLFSQSLRELYDHFRKTLHSDIWSNNDLSRFEWFCMLLESPFIIVRKLVTPIPCDEDYNRPLVAYSIALSPVWISYYLTTKMEDFDPFCMNDSDAGYCFPPVIWPMCISFPIGCLFLKFAPAEEASGLPLRVSIPIALFGFVIAATWIDVISDELVNLLEFLGVVLRIPAPIMGMTVLAWGNSVGDYTTNGALAQRGLADMSMAACFAGPSFNLLVGLGCGLLTQKESLLSDSGLPISLMPSVKTGFIFLICNCLLTIINGVRNEGIIPKMHGYMFWAMYLAYMTMNAEHML